MFHGDVKKIGARGGQARARNLTLEEQSLHAWRAISRRWYKFASDDIDRIDTYLRLLATVVAKAMEAGDDDKMMKAIAAMAPYERMKIVLLRDGASRPAITVENDIGEEAAKRYEEGKALANKDNE